MLVGFPLGGMLSLAIAGCAAVVLLPAAIAVTSLSQVVLPVARRRREDRAGRGDRRRSSPRPSARRWRRRCPAGYTLAQFFGWPWGKFRRPAQAARFHLTMIVCLMVGVGVLATGVDPVQVTEFSVVFSAIALPLTYLPILIVANDPEYMGEYVNGRAINALADLPGDHPRGLAGRDPTDDHHRSGPMSTSDRSGRWPDQLLDARLHLLDRQVLDVHGVPVTAVDDLELTDIRARDDATAGTPAPR